MLPSIRAGINYPLPAPPACLVMASAFTARNVPAHFLSGKSEKASPKVERRIAAEQTCPLLEASDFFEVCHINKAGHVTHILHFVCHPLKRNEWHMTKGLL